MSYRTTVTSMLLAIAALSATTALASAQERPRPQGRARPAAPTAAQKIEDATAAAPAAIARAATVKDWPASEGGAMPVLRAGTNGWVCLPTPPSTSPLRRDPMCIDEVWQAWLDAYMRKATPGITRTGYAYMLVSDAEASNTDPYATKATPDNHWHMVGPHLMVLYPDAKLYDGISTDPANGGPYVMFKGTPYAHVMWPVR